MTFTAGRATVLLLIMSLFFGMVGSLHAGTQMDLTSLQQAIEAEGAAWTAGENDISALPVDAFKRLCGTILEGINEEDLQPWQTYGETMVGALPSKFDWRAYKGKNWVTSVKTQQCQDCWAFAGVASLEMRLLIDTQQVYDLSEQLLVSTCCSAGDCSGGYISYTSNFLRDSGVPEESCYPYKNGQDSYCGEACSNWQQIAKKVNSSQFVNRSVSALKSAIYNRGPVNLGFMVYGDFQNYNGGIYKHVSGGQMGGHAVVAVGYDDEQQCFIVKNSWGKGWGEQGYFRIAYSEVNGDTQFGMDAHCYNSDIDHGSQTLAADFSYAVDGLTVAFSDKSTAGSSAITSWNWDFGDESSSTQQNPVHPYGKAGTYNVTLVVQAGTQADTVSKQVTVGSVQEYCRASGTNPGYEWIAGIAVGSFSNASQQDGYGDFTAKVISVEKGAAYRISLSPGFRWQAYSEAWRVWIDFNQDGDFLDDGETVMQQTSNTSVTGNITIPVNALSGRTRMRVAMQYNDYASPCGDFKWGEVEDYTVEIGGQSPPSTYCKSNGETQKYEWISGVAVGTFTHTSGASAYSYYDQEPIKLVPGSTAAVELTPGFGGEAYKERWRIWVDWNGDGNFEGRDEVVLSEESGSVLRRTLSVPADVTPKTTRMRVTLSYGRSFPEPCGTFKYGETEDYRVEIGHR